MRLLSHKPPRPQIGDRFFFVFGFDFTLVVSQNKQHLSSVIARCDRQKSRQKRLF
ncbi:hypothetical protein VB735_09595 [Halotia wernerae UHCC 0503]|nr:hypothetical protein [Halotia wernerae UHCC 0503]